MAKVKKPTSRRNGPLSTLNGLMMHMEPTTQEVMNAAAPSNSPIARPPESARIAEKVEKTSGLPLPKARKVTPATFSSKPRIRERVWRLEQKKSDAPIPRVEKRKASQRRRAENMRGRNLGWVQK